MQREVELYLFFFLPISWPYVLHNPEHDPDRKDIALKQEGGGRERHSANPLDPNILCREEIFVP